MHERVGERDEGYKTMERWQNTTFVVQRKRKRARSWALKI